jgi:Cu/Ag efflux protein CusF
LTINLCKRIEVHYIWNSLYRNFGPGYARNKLPVKPILFFVTITLCLACDHGTKPVSTPEKHYLLSGKVISVNAKDQTALIDAAAIPNYMEAMAMDYPIKSKAEFESLHPGDRITASVDVTDDGIYGLSHIKPQPTSKK